jgi:hypothetical protein
MGPYYFPVTSVRTASLYSRLALFGEYTIMSIDVLYIT